LTIGRQWFLGSDSAMSGVDMWADLIMEELGMAGSAAGWAAGEAPLGAVAAAGITERL
jgi:hypothetical protein